MNQLFYFLNADLLSYTPQLILRIKKHYPDMTEAEIQRLITIANQADPTGDNGDYTPWLIGEIIKGSFPQGFDAEEVKYIMRLFHLNKNRTIWKSSKAIQNYTWQTLSDTIDKTEGLRMESKKLSAHPAAQTSPGLKVVYNQGGWQVHEISSMEALMGVSQNTSWCTRDKRVAMSYLNKYEKMYCIYKNIQNQPRAFALWASPTNVLDVSDLDLSSSDYDKVFNMMMGIGVVSFDDVSDTDWIDFLKKRPAYVKYRDWSTLSGNEWSFLLIRSPKFAEYCDWNKLDDDNWSSLLCVQPQFADKCNWDLLNGFDWAWLLSYQPQFADRCNWSKLDADNWEMLLKFQPQFKKHRKDASLTRFLLER